MRQTSTQHQPGATAVGIDIGTCFARAAVLDSSGRPRLVADAYGDQDVPAVVRYTMHGSQVGYYPDRFLVTDWENTVREVPRFLGRYADLPPQVLAAAPFPVSEQDGRARFNLLYTTAGPEEVYSRLVRHMADQAAAALGRPVRAVALTVPANAEDRVRVSVGTALADAGLELLGLVNAPSAALLALRRLLPGDPRLQNGIVALVDIGGGTTDVSIARVDADGVTILATAGDPYLGGVELRARLAAGANARFQAMGADLLAPAGAATGHSRAGALALLRAADESMAALSTAPSADLLLDHGAGFGRDLWTSVTRRQFEDWIAPELVRLAALCGRALRQAGLTAGTVGAVALAGGCARIPAVGRAVAAAFGRRAADLIIQEPAALAAYGAALHAGMALGQVAGALRDVTPYPLGLAAYDEPYPGGREVFNTLIHPGTPIPTAAPTRHGACRDTFYPRYPGQTAMRLQVLQYRGPRELPGPSHAAGEPVLPAECETLGEWTLSGLRAEGHVAVDVTFHIDANGILHLSAQEQGTRNILRQSISRW
ncbi:MAG TPA: Hsp70 family protein [Chloroflexia bacterium]|nr:Hsp70 family protein [Chloroflexia bacterium]